MSVYISVKNEEFNESNSLRITVQEQIYKDGVPTELWKDVQTGSLSAGEVWPDLVNSIRRIVIEKQQPTVKTVVLTDAVEVKDA